MNFTRRQLAGLATALLLPGISRASGTGDTLFWRVKFPTCELTLFGYVRIASSFVPDILAEGKRLIDGTRSVLLDMNADVQLSTTDFDRVQLEPVLPKLASSRQNEIRSIIAASPAKEMIEKLSGFEIALILLFEGQHDISESAPGIGADLMNYGSRLGRPITRLLDDAEVRSAETPLTLEQARSAGPEQIGFLLDLRHRVGPIGAHFDELYKEQRAADIATLSQEINAKGIIMPPQIDQNRLRLLIADRIARLDDGVNAFTMLPAGVLAGRYGILDELRSRGAEVTAIS